MLLKKRSIPLLIIVLLLTVSGCGLGSKNAQGDFAALPYTQSAVHNFYLGEVYMSQGRYELAREQFAFALAATREDDMEMQNRIVEQLEAATRIIAASR